MLIVKPSTAGSAGDPNAAQLIIENRSVIIEYAREQTDRRPKDEGRRDDKQRALKGDWLCEAVRYFIWWNKNYQDYKKKMHIVCLSQLFSSRYLLSLQHSSK